MKFERSPNNRRTATFEIDPQLDLHERDVAVNALGTLTAKYYHLPERRIIPAKLGLILGNLQTRDTGEDGQSKRIPASIPLLKAQATVLGEALHNYATDTGAAVRQIFMSGNVYGTNIRAVEGEIAQTMLATITDEFGLKPPSEPRVFGFN